MVETAAPAYLQVLHVENLTFGQNSVVVQGQWPRKQLRLTDAESDVATSIAGDCVAVQLHVSSVEKINPNSSGVGDDVVLELVAG